MLVRCALLVVFSLLAATGCGGRTTPEAEVRSLIERVERAAQERDARGVLVEISPVYRDAYGHSREDVARLLRGYFLANQSISLLTRIEALDFPADDEARVTVLVAMLGRGADAAHAWDMNADLHRFEATIVREGGKWQITWARW